MRSSAGRPPSELAGWRSGPVPLDNLATWRSGYAAACKAVYTGSIPVVASAENLSARQLDVEYLPQRDGAAVLTPAGAFASTGAGEAV